MKTLILMRHANSDGAEPGQRDADRTLNGRGRLAASLMGAWLQEIGQVPDAALVSGAARTRETWSRMDFDCEAHFHDALYLAEPSEILAHLQAAPDCACLLILGHNPGMETAMGMMAGGKRISAVPATTAVYSLAVRDWQQATFADGSLVAFEAPKSSI